MAPYVGVAERAAELARESVSRRSADGALLIGLGELENTLAAMQMAFRELCENAADYAFQPVVESANRALIRKTLTANAALATVQKALEVMGGSGLYRKSGLERLLRDIQGAPFHPLPEKKQQLFSARVALGLEPIG